MSRSRLVIAIVLLIGVAGMLLAQQGWRVRTPTFDNVAYIQAAQDFIDRGVLPYRGTLTSYSSYTPPGPSWFFLPGMLLFSDPRLFEVAGCAFLYIGTLLGVFLIARMYFGNACAVLAAAVFGLSEIGLQVGLTLWPRFPIQFFYVWMIYWTCRWVKSRSPMYSAAAVVTWAAGMYVFLEIGTAIFVLPAVWLLYRPPLEIRSAIIAAGLILLIWFPYVRYQSSRGWVDVESQAFRQKLLPEDYRKVWCDPNAVFRTLNNENTSLFNGGLGEDRDAAAPEQQSSNPLFSNFAVGERIPGVSTLLGIALLLSMILFSMPQKVFAGLSDKGSSFDRMAPWMGAGLMVLAVLANEVTIERYLSLDGTLAASTITKIRWLQGLLIGAGIVAIGLRRPVARMFERVVAVGVRANRKMGVPTDAGVLVIGFILPWLGLLPITEANRLDRFWWLWPLQMVLLAGLVAHWSRRSTLHPMAGWAATAILLAAIVPNPLVSQRIESWIEDGWSGLHAPEIEIADRIATELLSQGRSEAAIGYEIRSWNFESTFNIVDPTYKVGAQIDLLLSYRGVSNLDQCAEGFHEGDEFRVYQTELVAEGPYRGYFEVPEDDRFHVVYDSGRYQLLRRK